MVKLGNTYFLFASMMTGWDANENQYTTSTSLRSGWSSWRKFADSGSKVGEPSSPSSLDVFREYDSHNVLA